MALKAVMIVFAAVAALQGFSQQNYSRVKIFATDAELYAIGQLGVTIDLLRKLKARFRPL